MDQEMVAYFDGRFREVIEQVQGLRGELAVFRDELTAFREQTEQDLTSLVIEGVIVVGERLESFRHEVVHQLKETGVALRLPYEDLSGRVLNLERRAERQTRDVLDVIRERYGKPQV